MRQHQWHLFAGYTTEETHSQWAIESAHIERLRCRRASAKTMVAAIAVAANATPCGGRFGWARGLEGGCDELDGQTRSRC